MNDQKKIRLEKIDDYRWRIPRTGKMQVEGLIYADERLLREIREDESTKQVANVAHLPGILKYSLAMPDIHWGYGFPIGGVAAFDWQEGVISPGGVGYDINCGTRLISTNLSVQDLKGKIKDLVNALYQNIPSGVGSKGALRLSVHELRQVLKDGSAWAVGNGYGWPEDLERTEDRGCMEGANPEVISDRAVDRGRPQLGTLGSGNHFLEVGFVDEIYNPQVARVFGLRKDQVTVLLHSGSRGLGYQVCDDFLKKMGERVRQSGLELPDRQLACDYIRSATGQDYFSGMACAANYAWANRQMLMHWTREVFERFLQMGPKELGMHLVYDLCHNIAKREWHMVDGERREVCVHRKGATRAFPAGHPAVPEAYRDVGQPVLIPGDMGRYSFVLVGTEQALDETFGSTCHGAGRVQSRTQAKKASKGRALHRELEDRGIFVMAASRGTLVEEAPEAYKDVSQVVEVVHQAGISRKVARLRPWGVIKG
ncbi:MAG: RtcB family protein [Deltaproteobacteria bacterium]|nr:RtcB family protein [Deltaproteobacteria bacterium]